MVVLQSPMSSVALDPNVPMSASTSRENVEGSRSSTIYRQRTSSSVLTVRAKAEANRREGVLKRMFPKWCWSGSEGVDFSFMQQVMLGLQRHAKKEKIVVDVLKSWQDELREVGGADMGEGSALDGLSIESFVQFWMQQLEEETPHDFDRFVQLVDPIAATLIEQITTTRRKRTLWQLFTRWDFNGNGMLDFDEIEVVVDTDKATQFPPLRTPEELGPGLKLVNFQSFVQDDLLKGGNDDKEFFKTVGAFLERIEQIRRNEEPNRQIRRELVQQALSEGLDPLAYLDRYCAGVSQARFRQSLEEQVRRERFTNKTPGTVVATIGGLHSEFKSPKVVHAVPRSNSPASGLRCRTPTRFEPSSPTGWRSPTKTPPRDINNYSYNFLHQHHTSKKAPPPTGSRTPTTPRQSETPSNSNLHQQSTLSGISPLSPVTSNRPSSGLGNPMKAIGGNRESPTRHDRPESAPLRPSSPILKHSASELGSPSCTLAGSTTIMRDSASDRLRARNRERAAAAQNSTTEDVLNTTTAASDCGLSPAVPPLIPVSTRVRSRSRETRDTETEYPTPSINHTMNVHNTSTSSATLSNFALSHPTNHYNSGSRPTSSCSIPDGHAVTLMDVSLHAEEQDWENHRELREKSMNSPRSGGWGWRTENSVAKYRDEQDNELQKQRNKEATRRKERERREQRSVIQKTMIGDDDAIGMDTGTGTLHAWNWHKDDRDKQEVHRQNDWSVTKKRAQTQLTRALGKPERGWGYVVSSELKESYTPQPTSPPITREIEYKRTSTERERPVRPASPPSSYSSSPSRSRTPSPPPQSRHKHELIVAPTTRPISPTNSQLSTFNTLATTTCTTYSKAVSQVKHALDGIRMGDVEQFLGLDKLCMAMPYKLINTILVPVCVLLDIAPTAERVNHEGIYWGVVSTLLRNRPEEFFRQIQSVDARYVTYDQLCKIKRFYVDADFDSSYVLPTSRLLSALCDWCKAIVNLCCVHNNWGTTTTTSNWFLPKQNPEYTTYAMPNLSMNSIGIERSQPDSYKPHPPKRRPVSPTSAPTYPRSASPTETVARSPLRASSRSPVHVNRKSTYTRQRTYNPRRNNYAARGLAPPYNDHAFNRAYMFRFAGPDV